LAVLAYLLLAAALVGVVAGFLQVALWERFRSRPDPVPPPERRVPFSILKPLCGIDDGLAANLESFVALDYPEYELLLGVESADDPAWAVAQALERRHPDRVRTVLRRGAPGLNPKVNQLLTLVEHARFEHVVISDSNVRVSRDYLLSVASLLADPEVGLAAHPVVGVGARRLGALLDNLHTTASIMVAIVASKVALRKDYVVGKSMALSKTDLAALGGFGAYRDAFAEDHLIGRHVPARLGKRVALSRTPVFHVTQDADLRGFWRRFGRWSVMQRSCAGYSAYALMVMFSPVALTALAALVHPSLETALALSIAVPSRIAIDGWVCFRAPGASFPPWAPLAAPLRDVLIALAWTHGLFAGQIEWRGKRFGVLNGSTLVPPEP
jgi:ceramide glucosyltransferase